MEKQESAHFHLGGLSEDTHPIGPELNGVWFALFVFAEGHMSTTSTDLIVILDDEKIIDGIIVESLL